MSSSKDAGRRFLRADYMLALASLLSVSPLGFSAVLTSVQPIPFVPMSEPPPEPTPACKTIAEIIAETESLKTLNAVVNAAPDVLAVLSNRSLDLTVFAPNDGAFENFGVFISQKLSEILSGHAISGVFTAEDVLALIPGFGEENITGVTTVNGETIYLGSQAFAPNSVFVGPVLGDNGPAEVVVPNIKACNGIVHIIDKVLGDEGDDEGDEGDDEGSCVFVRQTEGSCDCVAPDNPCLTHDGRGNAVQYGSGTCVPDTSCEDLDTSWGSDNN